MRLKAKTLSHSCLLLLMAAALPVPAANGQEADELQGGFESAATAGLESRLLEIGRRAFLENRMGEASKAFTELLRINPNHVEAIYRLAIVNFQARNYADGLAYVERAVELDPANPMPRIAYAKALEEIGRIDMAIQQYQYVLSQMGQPPDSPAAARADRSLGLLLLSQAERQRDLDGVRELGSQLSGKYPTDASVLHTVGGTYLRAGLVAEAEQTYKALTDLVPESPLAYFYLGTVYESVRELAQAEVQFKEARKRGAKGDLLRQIDVKLAVMRGLKLLQRGDGELARQAFLEAQSLEPLNFIANSNLARLSHSTGRLEESADAFSRMLKVEPGNLEARMRLGLIYLDTKRFIEALPELDFVIANDRSGQMAAMIKETYARLDQQLGGRLPTLRRLLAEKGGFEARLAANPNDAAALMGLGEIFQHQGKLAEAKTNFQRAVEIDPLLGFGYVRLGELAERENDLAAAIDYYQKALAAMVNDSEKALELQKRLMMTLGQQQAREGHYDLAEQTYTDVLNKFGVDKTVLWSLAIVASRLGEMEASMGYYNRLLEMDPSYMPARFNIGLLYEQMEEEEQALAEYRKVMLSGSDDTRLLKTTEERIKFLERSINGLGYSVGYTVGVDDNLGLAYRDKQFEYNSRSSLSVSYNYKVRKGVRFSFRFSPDYIIYHVSQSDFFTLAMMPSLSFKWKERQWFVGLNRTTQSSVLRPEQSTTTSDTLFGSVSWQGKEGVSYQSNASYRGFGSTLNPFFDANTYSLGINASRMGASGLPLSYGYNLTINQNTARQGNDYAYFGHSVNGRVDKSFGERWSGYLNGSASLNLYSNPDSYTGFEKRRVNLGLGLGLGANYRYDNNLSFFGGYDYSIQRSNLAVGFIYNRLQSIEGRQTPSLGSYARHSINFGVRYNF